MLSQSEPRPWNTGIHAAAQVIPGEDPAELEALVDGYHQQFQPATALERFLVDALVYADWQLRRLRRLEAQLWHNQIADARKSLCHPLSANAPLGDVFDRGPRVFLLLQRRLDSTERSYYRALNQLQHIQATKPAARPPAPGLRPPAPQSGKLASFPRIPQPSQPSPPASPVPPPPTETPTSPLDTPPVSC